MATKSESKTQGVQIPGHSPTSVSTTATAVLSGLLLVDKTLNIPPEVKEQASSVVFTPEADPFLPTPMRMSETASAIWAAIACFASVISQKRFNIEKPERIIVDVYSATLMLCSVFLFQVDGVHFIESKAVSRALHLDKGRNRETYRNAVSNIYKTRDERFFHLHGSLNATPTLQMLGLPEHRLDLEGAENMRAAKDIYRDIVATKDSAPLEIEANERWLQPGAVCRTIDEYAATSHGKQNIQEPLYQICKIQEQLPPVAWTDSRMSYRPLAGIKVLDLTKVIAGPTVTRVLALMGANVLRISTDTEPDALPFIADSQIGKRDANLNLKTSAGKQQLERLLREADVVVVSYRPGALEKLGFSRAWIHELARQRGTGLVHCRINCYGWTGEWSGRPGYQPISDAITGASWEQGKFLGLDEPVMPLFPNSDSQTGLLGGQAVMQALLRRALEGGSYNVDVALNTFNNWQLRKVGLHDQTTQAALKNKHPDFMPRHDTGFFEMAPMILGTTRKSDGDDPGQLWDRARFTAGNIRWGLAEERATYLDWRRIVSFTSTKGSHGIVLDFQAESCKPGSDEPSFS